MWEREHLLYLIIFTIVILKTKAASDVSNWIKFDRVSKEVPDDAIIGGHENGGKLYVIRAPHEGSMAPGKFFLSTRKAFIPWGSLSHPKTEFEFLCGDSLNYKWVPTTNNRIPKRAVVGGRSEANQETLYICRVHYGSHIIPGKVHPSHDVCYIPFGNKEIKFNTYEILVEADKVAPKISGKPRETVTMGKTIDIECKVIKSNPAPTISWQFKAEGTSNFVPIAGSNKVLRISNVDAKDAGVYKCIATNALGSNAHQTELTVELAPKISGKPRETVTMGKTIDIECKVIKSNPAPTISWQFKAEGTSNFVPIAGSNKVLRISNVDAKDAGVYKCIATNALGSDAHQTELTVELAPKISGKPRETVTMGKTIDIECKVIKSNPAPTISWQFKAKGSSDFVPIAGSNKVLRISNVDAKDAGVYKCIATNALGSSAHQTELTVESGSSITSSPSTEFNSVVGDLNLTIPCDAVGVPKPSISWKINGAEIKQDTRYSITDNGALVISYPEEADSNSYTCVAENNLGRAEATFKVTVHPFVYGTINQVNIREGTTKTLDCGPVGPTQSVRWYVDGVKTNIEERFYHLKNVEDTSADGNYTCRVSNKDGTYDVRTYQVNVATLQFSSNQEDPIIDWSGSELVELNCEVNAKPTPDIKWTFNGKELKNQKSTRLAVKKLGIYTCTATNIHGTIHRSFNVTTSYCLIPRHPQYIQTMPLLLTPALTWPVLNSNTDYVMVKHGQTVTFACPIHKEKTNYHVEFPQRNEITASCDRQDIFTVDDVSYQISNFLCLEEIESEIIRHKRDNCLTKHSELVGVGYDVADFLEVYEVCFATNANIPIYSRMVMSKSNRGSGNTYSWYKYPGLGLASGHTAHTCTYWNSSCCYTKTQLVNARDVGEGPPQKSTFIDPLNAVPLWLPCYGPHEQSPWALIEDAIRSRLDLYEQFLVWSGTHKIQNTKGGSTFPRYLWKVVRFAADDALAIIYVNGPSPSAADILCRNICADNKIVPWIHEHDDHTYCCEVDEFLNAFGLSATTVGKPL